MPPAPRWAPLPERIQAARLAKGFTPARLARALGVSVYTVERWESGASVPDELVRRVLADVLGWSPDFFNVNDERGR